MSIDVVGSLFVLMLDWFDIGCAGSFCCISMLWLEKL